MRTSTITIAIALCLTSPSAFAQDIGPAVTAEDVARGRASNAAPDDEPVPRPDMQPPADTIVVRGTAERKGSWRRAEGDHVVVYSNGREEELVRLTHNLDREYLLLSQIFGPAPAADEPAKLEVYLIGSRDFARKLKLGASRVEEGPFPRPFRDQRYYTADMTGAIMAVSRSDQVIPVSAAALSADSFEDFEEPDLPELDDEDGFHADPAFSKSLLTRRVNIPTIRRSWEGLAYSGFAQHFLLSRFPAKYPSWYLDGIGALFSTTEFLPDGSIEYGRTPEYYASVLNSYRKLPADEVLSGAYKNDRSAHWTPYQAWVMAHYFLLGEVSAERQDAFVSYMREFAKGGDAAAIAAELANAGDLNGDIQRYGEESTLFFTTRLSEEALEPGVTQLSRAEAERLESRLIMDARLGDNESQRKKYFDSLREDAKETNDPGAHLLLAEAVCKAELVEDCLQAAGAALRKSPSDPAALAWQAWGKTLAAIQSPQRQDALFPAARSAIVEANREDPENPVPLVAFFRLHAELGKPVPAEAIAGMRKVIDLVPSAIAPRAMLAGHLARIGENEEADRLLRPVGNSTDRQSLVHLVPAYSNPAPLR